MTEHHHHDYDDDRETIWGINRRDRPLFQLLTLLGGVAGSVILTLLILKYRHPDDTPDALAFSITLGIGASFVSAGFIAWGILQSKELTMSIAFWIKQRNARNQEKLREEGREEGREKGREEGIEMGREEGYVLGYDDAESGRPRRMGTDANAADSDGRATSGTPYNPLP